MNRRTVLRGAAGCLGVGDSNPDVVLPEPAREFTSEDLPYPAWGQQVPDVTLPVPIGGGEISARSVETPALYTFSYSHCNTVCPVLIQSMRNVQTRSIEAGYADEVVFLPVTFDPERDDAKRLDAGNWHFLRPSSVERAYRTKSPDPERMIGDLETVRNG